MSIEIPHPPQAALQQADALIDAYARRVGLDSLGFDNQGNLRLVLDGQAIDLTVDDATGRLHLYGEVGMVPLRWRENLYRHLLVGNLFGAATGGASLCIDPSEDDILLCQQLDLEGTSASQLDARLDDFAAALRRWSDLLSSGQLFESGERASRLADDSVKPALSAMPLMAQRG